MQRVHKFLTFSKHDIASASFTLHEAHCVRNITLCKLCNEPVPVIELQNHNDEVHQIIDCEACKQKVEIAKMEDHKVSGKMKMFMLSDIIG